MLNKRWKIHQNNQGTRSGRSPLENEKVVGLSEDWEDSTKRNIPGKDVNFAPHYKRAERGFMHTGESVLVPLRAIIHRPLVLHPMSVIQ